MHHSYTTVKHKISKLVTHISLFEHRHRDVISQGYIIGVGCGAHQPGRG